MSPVLLEAQIEQIAVDLFTELGWSHANVQAKVFGEHGTLGRETRAEVVLVRLRRRRLESSLPSPLCPDAEEGMQSVGTRPRALRLRQGATTRKAAGGAP